MNSKQNIGKVIREQRGRVPFSLNQLSKISGVSVAHLSRIEKGQRAPSPGILQKIAKPLEFDLGELLIMAGYLSAEPSTLTEEQRDKLRDELHTLLARVVTDNKRIKEITDRLFMTS